ncbi:MAG: hypothetical protein JWL84_6449 [Rhodospirillales bacterium]|jgi:hypothetical protein|nr:hypothetical protein [Rhodospirillales bacterium]
MGQVVMLALVADLEKILPLGSADHDLGRHVRSLPNID